MDEASPTSPATATPAEPAARPPLMYTPAYLAKKILTSRSALEGERKRVTVLFADLKSSMELLADRDPEEARQLLDPVLERAVGLCQDWHIPLLLPINVAMLGLAYALEGRIAAGLALVENGAEQEGARGRPRGQALVVTWLGEAYLLAGRLEEAHQRAGQAVDLARQYQERGTQAWALWLLGESTAQQASAEVKSAADHYHQALALAEELGMRPLQAHCHRGLGMLYAKMRQREHAHAELSTAIALYRAMAITFWLPQAEAALAQMA